MNSTRLASDLSLEDGSRANSVSKYDKVKRASCVFAVQECAPKHRASSDCVLMHEIFLYLVGFDLMNAHGLMEVYWGVPTPVVLK